MFISDMTCYVLIVIYEAHAGAERKKRDSHMFNSVWELSTIGQRGSTNVHRDKHIHAHNSSLRIFFLGPCRRNSINFSPESHLRKFNFVYIFILIKRITRTTPLLPEWEKDEQVLFSTLLLLPFRLSKGYR